MKIAFLAGLCLFFAAAIIISYSATALRTAAVETATERAIAVAESKALLVNEDIELALEAARLLAQTLAAAQDSQHTLDLNREQVTNMLRKIAADNPQFVGVYTIWEPGAFDADGDAAADDGLVQAEQFAVYWSRQAGNIALEPVVQPDGSDGAETGAYYQCARQTRLECVTDPYVSVVQGEEILLSSLVVPIIVQGEFYGIAGVDIKLDFFQSLADNVDLYEGSGMLIVLTHNGTIAAATGMPELAGTSVQNIDDDFIENDELSRIQQGESVLEFNADDKLEIFLPIQLGRSLTYWSVGITVPRQQITADATVRMWQLIGIGAGFTLLALVVLWFVTSQITTPIKKVTAVARRVAQGDLDVRADVSSKDETGTLADAFNQMIANLYQTIEDNRKAQDELMQQNAEQRRLLELVETLETPAISLMDGVLFAPIVGAVDSRRAQVMTGRLLHEVHERHIRQIILDISGVAMVDTQVAHELVQMVRALRLLGCNVTITGISAEVAATITQLGVSLEGVATSQSPQDVLNQLHTTRRMS
jgi:methyl-accepting chemotaxis protein